MEYLIPHYGDFALLKRAVNSVYATDPDAVVLIGDDTGELSDKQFKSSGTRIIPGPQTGFAANVNNLVKEAKGEWICIMNNDITLARDWCKELSNILTTRTKQDFSIASTVLRPNGQIDSLGDAISWYGIGFNRYHLAHPRPRYLRSALILGATGGLAVLRRQVFLTLGGYSTVLQSYCEDTQLNLRAAARGYRSWYFPAPHAVHQGTSTFAPEKKYYQSARNSILYIRIECGGPFRATLLRRVTAYWRMKAVVSRRFRLAIRSGIKDGYATVIKPSTKKIIGWPKGSFRENFWQTHLRLGRQVLASVRRRWYS